MSVRSRRFTAALLLAASAGALVTGCGDTDDAATDDTSPTTTAEVTATGAWARSTAPGAENGAAYMVLNSSADNALVSASVDPSVAGVTQVHEVVPADSADDGMGEGMDEGTETTMGDDTTMAPETTMATDDTLEDGTKTTMAEGTETTMGSGMDEGMDEGMGEMTMREVEKIDLPAGEDVVLEPGGYHIMLMELAAPLEVGQTIKVTLKFSNSPDLVVDVPVRDTAP